MVLLQAKPLEQDNLEHALSLRRALCASFYSELNLWQAQNIWYDTLMKSSRFLLGLWKPWLLRPGRQTSSNRDRQLSIAVEQSVVEESLLAGRGLNASTEPESLALKATALELHSLPASPAEGDRAIHRASQAPAVLLLEAPRRARLRAKYHFAGRSASSISINPGLNLKSLGLLHHGELVLANRAFAKELGHLVTNGTPHRKHSRHRTHRYANSRGGGRDRGQAANHLLPQRRVS